jgi:LacI family transcriptional regulator
MQDSFDLTVLTARSNSFASGMKIVEEYLAAGNRPDAIIGTNDELALAGLRAAETAGLAVPQDLMVTGFNGFQPAAYTSPSITTVVSRASELGEAAGELLMERLSGKPFASNEKVLPVTFRKGESTR